jgi:hypothetical protein
METLAAESLKFSCIYFFYLFAGLRLRVLPLNMPRFAEKRCSNRASKDGYNDNRGRIVSNIALLQSDAGQSSTIAPHQISAYFLDLEGLLARIEAATTYYQILDIDRTDGQDRIKSSFEQTVNLLFPEYVIGRTTPPEISDRIDRAFTKVAQAFAVLASFSKRKEYDIALLSISQRPSGVPKCPAVILQSQSTVPSQDKTATKAVNSEKINLKRRPQRKEVFSEATRAKPGDNRRRVERFKISIPVRLTGCDRRGVKWNEMAETTDVGRTGIKIRMRRRVTPGTVLYVTLPLPSKLRSHGFAEPSFNVYSLIQRVDPPRQGVRTVALEFIGEHPPTGFLSKPWASFRRGRSSRKECRRPHREPHVENITIEYFDESMRAISKDEAQTENVSSQGLRISGTSTPAEFDLVRVSCQRLNFEAMAALRDRYTGDDGVERVCVQFIGKEWPLLS